MGLLVLKLGVEGCVATQVAAVVALHHICSGRWWRQRAATARPRTDILQEPNGVFRAVSVAALLPVLFATAAATIDHHTAATASSLRLY